MTPNFRTPLDGARYARRAPLEFVTIPCQPKSKPPADKWAAYQKQRPTDAQYALWQARFPNANWAFVTGCRWDLIVLDQDGPEGLATRRRLLGEPPRTAVVRSPAGPARLHYWFRAGGLQVVHGFVGGYSGDLPHLDLRADGNLCMCPGSYHPRGGQYQFAEGLGPDDVAIAQLSDWPALYEYILEHNERLARAEAEWQERAAQLEAETARGFTLSRERRERPDRLRNYADAALQRQLAALRGCDRGQRNAQLFRAAAALSRFVTAGALDQALVERELEGASIQNGLVRDDGIAAVRRTIASGLRAGRYNPVLLQDRPRRERV